MTKEQLFDAMGDIRDLYVLSVARQMEKGNKTASRSRRTLRTVLLLAAALALLTLTVFAAEYWDFGSRLIRSKTAPANSQTLPQTYLSLAGIESSPEAMATGEWLTFRDDYINQKNAENNTQWKAPDFRFTAGDQDAIGSCRLYGAWDKTMYDMLLSIAQKHGLRLHTGAEDLPGGKTSHDLRIYENNAFVAEGYTPFQGKYCYYLVRREHSGTMPCERVILYHADDYREEPYTTAQKATVHLAIPEGQGMGLIFYEHGNAFLSVEITLCPIDSGDWPELLQAVADALDFDALCKTKQAEEAVALLQPEDAAVSSAPTILPESTPMAETNAAVPSILRVQPRVITVELAKQAATALFGGSPMYEYTSEETKGEIEALIAAWEYGITDEAIRESYGESISNEVLAQIRNTRQEILDYYIGVYPYAREDIAPIECRWTFWPTGHYNAQGHDYQNQDTGYTGELPYGSTFELQLTSTINGIPYLFSVANRDAADFRYHGLSVYMNTSYFEEEDALLRTMDITPNPVTQKEIYAAEQQMKQLVTAMGLGEFDFTAETYTRMAGQNHDELLGDILVFTGVPYYGGLPVRDYENMGDHVSVPGLSNYYPESLTIHCTRSGELIMLTWSAPMEVVEVVEETCAPMSHEEVAALAWPQGKPETAAEYPCTAYAGDVAYTRIRENDTYFLLIPTQH